MSEPGTPRWTSEITVRLIQAIGDDRHVVAAAKVSVDPEQSSGPPECGATNAGLIRYLMRHRHGTPFEHGSMTFRVHAPIFVLREWHRHRVGWSYNEESARYRPLDPVFWVPARDRAMVPVAGWKPSRPKFLTLDAAFGSRADDRYAEIVQHIRAAAIVGYESYRRLIDGGAALEVARAALPVSIYSSCWATCNPRSLMHFLSLRTHDADSKFPSYPQAEIEDAARRMEAHFRDLWPITWTAWNDLGRVAP